MKISPLKVNLRAVVTKKFTQQDRNPKTKKSETVYMILVQFIGSLYPATLSLDKQLWDKIKEGQIVALDTVLAFTKIYWQQHTMPAPRNDVLLSAAKPPEPKPVESLKVTRYVPCVACGATGLHPSGPGKCPRCGGRKEVPENSDANPMNFGMGIEGKPK